MNIHKRNAVLKGAALFFVLLGLSGLAFSYWVGGQLVAPRPATVGPPPVDLHAEPVLIDGKPRPIHGWWIAGDADKGSVLLLHGIRANRTAMIGRARMLAKHGYSVLLIDLQAHGESSGDAITLGLRESAGVQSAREWIGGRRPGEPIAAIGVSLGGASILLGPSPSGFDAVVLEAVYPDARQALRNRMAMRFGPGAPLLSKLLEVQVKPRLGISVDRLRPIDHIAVIGAPVMIIAGGRDQHTTPNESAALFASARYPKEYWLLPQAAHEDFQNLDPAGYEARVLGFLHRHLAGRATSTGITAAHPPVAPAQAGN
ncbi:alpha/beta hydrolase [Pseudoxanthomonas sacheonensis]|uniref:alpha/beta hydrolase n=1 Tax=Pseudoxanthomonas sacheonensis TaxID=443615 RepID=UPI0013D11D34|nr:alpha/beta hydrolase [Pseudoxanthomonas sacheonensis]